MKLKFDPFTKGKAFYSDTNYQLLGGKIETITDKSFNTMIKIDSKGGKRIEYWLQHRITNIKNEESNPY